MYKAIVFAGTTEGYALCEFLAENHVPVYACAATEYGGSLLKENEFLHVSAGRLKTEDMEELFRREAPEIVLDATHPYAAEVTKISGLPVRTEASAISVSFARRGRRTGKPSMWKARRRRQSFFPVQRGIFFLPQEARSCLNLQ